MEKSFFNTDDYEDSFLNVPIPVGSDISFLEDSSMFNGSGDGEQSQDLYMTPRTDASQAPDKRKKPEEKITPSSDESQMFMSPSPWVSQTPAKKMKKQAQEEEKTTSTTPTPVMKSPDPADLSEQKISTIEEGSATTSPPAAQRKDDQVNKKKTEAEAKEVPPKLMEIMEKEMKNLKESLMALQAHQSEGGDQLLAQAAAIQEEVSTYEQHLTHIKERYKERVNLALSCITPTPNNK